MLKSIKVLKTIKHTDVYFIKTRVVKGIDHGYSFKSKESAQEMLARLNAEILANKLIELVESVEPDSVAAHDLLGHISNLYQSGSKLASKQKGYSATDGQDWLC